MAADAPPPQDRLGPDPDHSAHRTKRVIARPPPYVARISPLTALTSGNALTGHITQPST